MSKNDKKENSKKIAKKLLITHTHFTHSYSSILLFSACKQMRSYEKNNGKRTKYARFYKQMLAYTIKRHIFGTMSTVAKNFRIDSELNNQASKLLEGLGLSMSQAISMFLKQVVLHRGLPFEVKYSEHSSELLDAIEEAKRLEVDPKTKRYTNMDEMWADLDK